jgi:hypothetical protein
MRLNFGDTLAKDKILINLSLGLILLTILWGAYFFNPEEVTFASCFFHEKTGLSCPTCGLSRSFFSFSHLQIYDAFQFHLFGPLLYLSLLLLLSKWIVEIISNREVLFKINPKLRKQTIFILIFAWLSFFVIRLTYELIFV